MMQASHFGVTLPAFTDTSRIDDAELAGLHVAAEEARVTRPLSGLYDAIARLCDWELQRRRGIDLPLSDLYEAINPEELASSRPALAVFDAAFHARPRIVALLDAIGGRRERRHRRQS